MPKHAILLIGKSWPNLHEVKLRVIQVKLIPRINAYECCYINSILAISYSSEFSGSLLPLIIFVLPPIAIIIIQYNWSRGCIVWGVP